MSAHPYDVLSLNNGANIILHLALVQKRKT